VATTVTQEEYAQLERSLREKILDKAVNDPDWRQQYVDNPEDALSSAGFPEAQQLREVHQSMNRGASEEDVQGHDYYGDYYVCYNYTTYYEYAWYYVDT
jgi:hypothetical protein